MNWKILILFAIVSIKLPLFAQCPIAEIVKNNKSKISHPYVYDGFNVSNLNFDDQERTVHS